MGFLPNKGSQRVYRGGSWNNSSENCRVAYRNRNDQGNRNNNLGFRLSQHTMENHAVQEATQSLIYQGKEEEGKSRPVGLPGVEVRPS